MAEKQETWEQSDRARAQSERLRWMVNLRWVGLAGIALTGMATILAGYARLLPGAWALAPLAVVYNLLFLFWLRWLRQAHRDARWPLARIERHLRSQAYLQALCDIVTMFVLVYLNGGVECPIIFIPLLAVMFSSISLPVVGLFLQANLGAVLFAATAFAELAGWLPHVPFLDDPYRHNLYQDLRAVLSSVLAMASILNLTAIIMSQLGRRLRQADERTRLLLGQLRRQVKEAAGRLATASQSLEAGADEVTQVAGQIAATVQQIAHGAAQQASQLDHLSHNLDHLADAARRVADGSQESHVASAEAVSSAARGRQAAVDATSRMEDIARVFAQAEQALEALSLRSSEIAHVASTIDHFAERTDLLALNAGIEAARAGEHGRGFAVVASEVKKLATSSSSSAEQVAQMVQQVQSQISDVASSVQAGADRVLHGRQSIATLQDALGAMAAVVARTDELVGTMEHLSRQQLETQRELTRAAGDVAAAAEQTAAGAEETAAAVEQQVASFTDFRRSVQEIAALAVGLDQAVAGLTGETGTPGRDEVKAETGRQPFPRPAPPSETETEPVEPAGEGTVPEAAPPEAGSGPRRRG